MKYFKSFLSSRTYGYSQPCKHKHASLSAAWRCASARGEQYTVEEVEEASEEARAAASCETFPKKRGRPQYGPDKRVVVTARVTPETAAKLRELAEKAGSVGLALDRLLNPASAAPLLSCYNYLC